MNLTDQDVAEGLRTATNEFGLIDLLVAEKWHKGCAALDDALQHNVGAMQRSQGGLSADLEALRTATNERRLIALLLDEQWTEAAEALAASYRD